MDANSSENVIFVTFLTASKIITLIKVIFFREQAVSHAKFSVIMRIKKVYGAEICVFMAYLRGVTSGLSISGDFCPFLAIFVNQRTLFFIF